MMNALFTTLAALSALLLVLALLLLIPGVNYPVVALAKLSQAPGGMSLLLTKTDACIASSPCLLLTYIRHILCRGDCSWDSDDYLGSTPRLFGP